MLPLYETAQTLATQLPALLAACGAQGIAALPDPWHLFAQEALDTIRTVLTSLAHPEEVHVL